MRAFWNLFFLKQGYGQVRSFFRKTKNALYWWQVRNSYIFGWCNPQISKSVSTGICRFKQGIFRFPLDSGINPLENTKLPDLSGELMGKHLTGNLRILQKAIVLCAFKRETWNSNHNERKVTPIIYYCVSKGLFTLSESDTTFTLMPLNVNSFTNFIYITEL